jgi:hypothetical protein
MEYKFIFAVSFLCLTSSSLSASAEVENQCQDQTRDGGREVEESIETGYIDESLNELDQVGKKSFLNNVGFLYLETGKTIFGAGQVLRPYF